jgi:hypothetical protein
MTRLFTVLLIFTATVFNSQNKQVLYNFAELPQTLLLNPGAETNFKFHIGVPLLSGISSEFGSTGFSVSDLFAVDNKNINDKVSTVINKIGNRDHVKFNFQLDVFNAGYRYNDNIYFSFGFYEEVDGISYFPKDLLILFTEGNSNSKYLNKSFNVSNLLYKVDVLGVFHFGVTKKINEKLTFGTRFKIYSSALNMETSHNSGTLTTVNGSNNIYTHYIDNVNINLKTSGIVDQNQKYIKNPKDYLKKTFLSGNLGLGLDVGLTYHISDQLEFTGSIVDFGFIKHKKNIKNSFLKGNYVFEGLEFGYNSSNSSDPTNSWDELNSDIKEKLPSGDNQDAYISWRPTKINTSLKYSFGEKRSKLCYNDKYKDFYTNALGVQLYTIFRPLSPQLALTGFYETSFSQKLHAKITYTLDDYSFYNIGAGLSAQLGKLNVYGMVDNIAQFRDIATANNISFQLGINLIFN